MKRAAVRVGLSCYESGRFGCGGGGAWGRAGKSLLDGARALSASLLATAITGTLMNAAATPNAHCLPV